MVAAMKQGSVIVDVSHLWQRIQISLLMIVLLRWLLKLVVTAKRRFPENS
jgi:predicted ABC-type sugar transport system permease subunit